MKFQFQRDKFIYNKSKGRVTARSLFSYFIQYRYGNKKRNQHEYGCRVDG